MPHLVTFGAQGETEYPTDEEKLQVRQITSWTVQEIADRSKGEWNLTFTVYLAPAT